MAKQAGILQIRGTIDNLNFQKREEGFFVGKKTGVDKERILTDPKFERTRETIREFGVSGKAAKFVLKTFREVVSHKPDSKIMSRLLQAFVAVTRSDQSHTRGQRTPWDGDLSLLRSFEFNKKGEVAESFYGSIEPSINRVAGTVEIEIPPYIPYDMVRMPKDATHYRFVAGGLELDLQGETCVRDKAVSAYLPAGTSATLPLTLTCSLTPASTLPIFAVFGIEFALEDGGQKYPLKGGHQNGIAIVAVDA